DGELGDIDHTLAPCLQRTIVGGNQLGVLLVLDGDGLHRSLRYGKAGDEEAELFGHCQVSTRYRSTASLTRRFRLRPVVAAMSSSLARVALVSLTEMPLYWRSDGRRRGAGGPMTGMVSGSRASCFTTRAVRSRTPVCRARAAPPVGTHRLTGCTLGSAAAHHWAHRAYRSQGTACRSARGSPSGGSPVSAARPGGSR